jgi:hypothetical protein
MNEMRKLMEATQSLFQDDVNEAASDDVYEAFVDLMEIQNELDELSERAKTIMGHAFPEEAYRAERYGALSFGRSNNPHDVTLNSILQELEPQMYNDGDDEY